MTKGDLYLDKSDGCILIYLDSHPDVFGKIWHIFTDTNSGRWEYDAENFEYLEVLSANK